MKFILAAIVICSHLVLQGQGFAQTPPTTPPPATPKPAAPAPDAPDPVGPVAVFDADVQGDWKIKKGNWKWNGTKLSGRGAGSIIYDLSLKPPFVAKFKFNSVAGLRASVHFQGVALQNAAYVQTFGLNKTDFKTYFPYKSKTVYQIVMVVTKAKVDLYVDGKFLHSAPGREKTAENITIYSGDDWSPGGIDVEDFIVYRGTDKVPE